jgi:hypothetical protein
MAPCGKGRASELRIEPVANCGNVTLTTEPPMVQLPLRCFCPACRRLPQRPHGCVRMSPPGVGDFQQAFDHERHFLRCRATEAWAKALNGQGSDLADLHPRLFG